MKKILMAGLAVVVLASGSVAWGDIVGSWISLGNINDPNPMPAGASWIETYNSDGSYHIDVVVPGELDCYHDGNYSVDGNTLTLHADTITCADQKGLDGDFSRYFMVAGPTLVTQEVVGGMEGQQVEVYEQYPALPATTSGWNLLGGKNGQPLEVADLGDVISVWKWSMVNNSKTWAVNLPGVQDNGKAYANSKGFGQFTTIEPGEGFWVNMPTTTVTTTTIVAPTSTTAPSVTMTILPTSTTMAGPIVTTMATTTMTTMMGGATTNTTDTEPETTTTTLPVMTTTLPITTTTMATTTMTMAEVTTTTSDTELPITTTMELSATTTETLSMSSTTMAIATTFYTPTSMSTTTTTQP